MELFANFWDAVFWFVVLLTPLVFVHELGHYAVARWCGVRVDVFSIGFGRELVGWTAKSGTRWKICVIPLGGYIKMFGEHMLEPNDDGEVRELTDEEKAVSFEHKPLWRRAAIVAAGPGANYVFAVVLFALIFGVYGQSYTPPTIVAIAPDSAAAAAGIAPGDTVISINGRSIDRFEELRNYVALRPGETVPIEVERDGAIIGTTVTIDTVEQRMIDDSVQKIGSIGVGLMAPVVAGVVKGSAAEEAGFLAGDRVLRIADVEIGRFEELRDIVRASPGKSLDFVIQRDNRELTLPVIPKPTEDQDAAGNSITVGQLGVAAEQPPTKIVRYGPSRTVWNAIKRSAEVTTNTLTGLWQVVTGRRESKELGGPIMIAQVSGKVAGLGVGAFLSIMASFSVTLGLINLFPVPVLDGGHLALYSIEAVRRRPLSERAQEYSFKVGLAMVLSLMVFVMVNDLMYRLPDFWAAVRSLLG